MKKFLAAMLAMALCLVTFGALAQAYEPDRTVKYPAGKLVIYGYGNPQAYEEQFKMWCAMHPEQTEGVEIEVVQCEGAEDVRKKIMLTYQSGAYEDLPDLIATQAATLYAMADTGIVLETTDYMDMLKDDLLDGVCGGIAEYFGIDPTVVRLIWALFSLMGGCGILAYIIAAIIIPRNPVC